MDETQETPVLVCGDGEIKGWLDALVAKGVLEEVALPAADQPSFRITPKGDRLLSIAAELGGIIRGGWSGPLSTIWRAN